MKFTNLVVIIIALAFLAINAESLIHQGNSSNIIEARSIAPIPAKTGTKAERKAKAATSLLSRAPILDPKPDGAFSEEEFLALAQQVTGNSKLKSTLEAIEALEEDRADFDVGDVTATITSEPAGWTVQYKDYLDYANRDRGVWLTVRTPATPSVAGMQIFVCTKSDGQSCGQQIRPCDNNRNCTASF